LGGRIEWEAAGPDQHRLWVLLPRRQTLTLLVVDDKPDLFALFLRYLAGHPYQLCHAPDARVGLQMVREIVPDMILLDLMMPEHDGWEFLQALRADTSLTPIPVIVCSVLHEPALAFSLGAQAYLKKPVAADELVQALEQVRGQVWAAGRHPAAPAPDQSPCAC
jgi:CheY-like chemotaxis protein